MFAISLDFLFFFSNLCKFFLQKSPNSGSHEEFKIAEISEVQSFFFFNLSFHCISFAFQQQMPHNDKIFSDSRANDETEELDNGPWLPKTALRQRSMGDDDDGSYGEHLMHMKSFAVRRVHRGESGKGDNKKE